MPLNARLVYKIVGGRLLLLLLAAALLYSSASSFIGYTLSRTAYLYQDEVRPTGGMGIISVYSGAAITPITGLVNPEIIEKARRVPGVVAVWGETSTPCLVNDTLAVVRGVPPKYYEYAGINVVAGRSLGEGDYTGALVGAGLANTLRVRPGDILVVDSYFTATPLLLSVEGVAEAPPPYRYEVIVNPATAKALRGVNGYSTVRIIYNPSFLDKRGLEEALGVRIKRGFLLSQAVLLVSKGWGRVMPAVNLQEYYLSRLGVPASLIVAAGLLSDALLSILMVPLAWAIVGLREKELAVLIEEGISRGAVRLSLGIVTSPAVLAGILAGLLAPLLAPPILILGYPIAYSLDSGFAAAHSLILFILYGVGIATARLGQ